jgi:hypothetical protein
MSKLREPSAQASLNQIVEEEEDKQAFQRAVQRENSTEDPIDKMLDRQGPGICTCLHCNQRLFWSLIASWWSLIALLCNLPPKLSSARQEEDRGC